MFGVLFELFAECGHRPLRVLQFGDADVEVALQLLELGLLLLVQVHEVPDEVQEVSRRNVVELLGRLHELDIEVAHGGVNLDDTPTQQLCLRVDALVVLPVLNRVVGHFDGLGEAVVGHVDVLRELLGHLEKPVVCPVAEPVDDAPVKQRRRRSSAIREVGIRRVHGKHYVEVALNVFCELAVDLFLGVERFVRFAGFFLAGGNQLGVLIAVEQPWHFTAS